MPFPQLLRLLINPSNKRSTPLLTYRVSYRRTITMTISSRLALFNAYRLFQRSVPGTCEGGRTCEDNV